jgi:hypothetical protein
MSARRAWFRSLYWRIAAGFVVFLAATLAVQVALFLWIVARGEGDVPARSLETFASLVASDVASEVDANRAAQLDHHLTERYGSLPRTIWAVLDTGQVVHADAVAENGSARIRAGRINGHDTDRLLQFAVLTRQVVDQRALARPGSAGESDDARPAAVGKQGLEQQHRFRRAVFDGGNGPRQTAHVAGADHPHPRLKPGWSAVDQNH